VPEAEVTAALADALVQVNPSAFGLRTDLAQALLAAHHLSMAHPDLVAKIVQSESVGPISTTYATSSGSAASSGGSPLAETSYGRRYLLLLRQVAPLGPMVV
jgi:hypothetical protein